MYNLSLQNKILIILFIAGSFFYSCNSPVTSTQLVLPSPDSQTHIYFNLNDGEPYYLVYHNEEMIINWSLLGLKLENQIDFSDGMTLVKSESASINSAELLELEGGYTLVQQYNELKLSLRKSSMPDYLLKIVLKACNYGIGISYTITEVSGESDKILIEDRTQINLAGANDFWTISEKADSLESIDQTTEQESFKLPLGFKSKDGIELIITEEVFSGVAGSVIVRRLDSKQAYHFKPPGSEFSTLNLTHDGFVTPIRTMIFKDLTQQPLNK